MPDEAQLLKQAAGGDELAAAELYDRHAPALLRYLTITLSDAQAAEDVLQETFLYVLKTAARYDPAQSALTTWLHCVALNLARNEMRRRRRKSTLSLDTQVPDGDKLRPLSDVLQARPDGAEQQDKLGRALHFLNRLPDEDREVLILRYVENMPPREIAKVLGLKPKATSMRIWRAIKDLQALMRREDQVDR